MSGPLPKPNAIKKAEGLRGKRPLTKEPRHAAGSPAKLKITSRGAAKIWEEFIDTMDPAMLCRTDRRALWQLAEDESLLAEAYQGFWKMAAALKAKAQAEGNALPSGEIMALLSMKNGKQAMNAIRDLSARVIIERREFGMTPSSRARINMTGEQAMDDPIDEAIFNGRTEMFVLPKPN